VKRQEIEGRLQKIKDDIGAAFEQTYAASLVPGARMVVPVRAISKVVDQFIGLPASVESEIAAPKATNKKLDQVERFIEHGSIFDRNHALSRLLVEVAAEAIAAANRQIQPEDRVRGSYDGGEMKGGAGGGRRIIDSPRGL
jgi:hypothetical protein